MNGDAHATGSDASQPLPPAFTRDPQSYAPAAKEVALHAPFFPGQAAAVETVAAAPEVEATPAESTPEPWESPEAFGYEAAAEPLTAPEAPAEPIAEMPAFLAAEPAAEAPDFLAEEPTAEAPAFLQPEATAERQAFDAPPEPPAFLEAEAAAPVAFLEPEPAGQAVLEAPPLEPDLLEPAPLPESDALEPMATYAEPLTAPLPEIEEPLPTLEAPAPGHAVPAGPASEVAARLEALARQLRERGGAGMDTALTGDTLDAALAGLISGYLAGRGR